jgi:phosphatidylethanolamine-binding protein (PEBP) family uncharacterized protein
MSSDPRRAGRLQHRTAWPDPGQGAGARLLRPPERAHAGRIAILTLLRDAGPEPAPDRLAAACRAGAGHRTGGDASTPRLLYRGLRQRGIYAPQPGWPLFYARLGCAMASMGAALWWAAGSEPTGCWSLSQRLLRLSLVVSFGAASISLHYGLPAFACATSNAARPNNQSGGSTMKLSSNSFTDGERDPGRLSPSASPTPRTTSAWAAISTRSSRGAMPRRHPVIRPHLPRPRRPEPGRRRQSGRPHGAGVAAARRFLPLAAVRSAGQPRRDRRRRVLQRRDAARQTGAAHARTTRARGSTITPGWFAGDNDMRGDYYGYDGPCPPWNDEIVHRYVFTLFALDVAEARCRR